jgi:hypothetical protein
MRLLKIFVKASSEMDVEGDLSKSSEVALRRLFHQSSGCW